MPDGRPRYRRIMIKELYPTPDCDLISRYGRAIGDHDAAERDLGEYFRGKLPASRASDVISVVEGYRWAGTSPTWRCRPAFPTGTDGVADWGRRKGCQRLGREEGPMPRGTERPARCLRSDSLPTDQNSRVTIRRALLDLVLVFAVTQISHTNCSRNLPRSGRCNQPCCWLSVWWVWVYTSWVTKFGVNPELSRSADPSCLWMLGGLVLSTSISKGFQNRAVVVRAGLCREKVGRTDLLADIDTARRFCERTRGCMNAVRIWSGCRCTAVFMDRGAGLGAIGHMAGVMGGGACESTTPRPPFRFWYEIRRLVGGGSRTVEWRPTWPSGAGRDSYHQRRGILVVNVRRRRYDLEARGGRGLLSALSARRMWGIYFHKGPEAGSEIIVKFERAVAAGEGSLNYLHLSDRRMAFLPPR